MNKKSTKIAIISFCITISLAILCLFLWLFAPFSNNDSEYEKYNNEPYIVNGFDYSEYIDEDDKFVHYEEHDASVFAGKMESMDFERIIIYEKANQTYFAIKYYRDVPNEVVVYENLTKEDIEKEKITSEKDDWGYSHTNYDVNSNDNKVWILNEEKGKIITY